MRSVKIDRAIRVLMGLLLVALVYVIYAGIHQQIIEVGDIAPDFAITADNGRSLGRADFGGRLLVLNFWATWCPPCVQEMPSLEQFHKQLAPSGVVVLGISVDKDEKTYRDFLARAGVSFLTARDSGRGINAEYGTFQYPETYIIDSKGKVVQKIIGAANWTDARMVSYVKSLL